MHSSQRTIGGLLVALCACTLVSATQATPPAGPTAQTPLETAAEYQGAAAEDFLTRARVVSIRDLGTGVTLPSKVTLELDGVERFAVFKTIDDRRTGITQLGSGAVRDPNFQDSWQTEIPAYVVDLIIGLGMVPATVERRINGKVGSLQWFVTTRMAEAVRMEQRLVPPDMESWDREMLRMRLFDQLIYNVDRHANNVLITEDFHLRLIDHSRSFRPQKTLRNPEQLTRFSRSLLEGLERLTYEDLRAKTRRYLTDTQIRTLLDRRDAILELARRLVAERGEAAVLYP